MKILVSLLFVFVLKSTIGNINVVQRCPETKTAWDHRASRVTCKNKDMKYHCIMSSTWTLLEVCITPLNISENEDGCPAVYIFKSSAFWMFPFTPCSTQNTDCPQKGNGGYSSEQLFKYPACFLNLIERVSGDTELQQTTKETVSNRISKYSEHREEFYRTDVIYLLHLSIFTLLLLCILSVLYFLQKRLIKQLIKKVTEQRTMKCEAQSSNPSSVIDLELKESKSFVKPFHDESSAVDKSKNMFKVDEGYSSLSKDVKGKYYTTQPVSDLRNGSTKTLPCLENEYSRNCSTSDVKRNEHTPRSLPELRNETRRTPPVMDSRNDIELVPFVFENNR